MDSAGHDILPSTPRCTVVDWRGERVRTLPDRLPPGARAAVVALHPTRCGVDDGHHLHQRLGQQALRRVLAAAGVVPAPGEALDDALVGAGIGIATVVKRPAGREPDLAAGDVAYGVPLLRAELQRHGIGLVVCPFEPAARALAGGPVPPGVHDIAGLRVVRLAAPFAPAAQRDAVLTDLASLLTRS